jgi:uncharacterized protein YukJ
VTGPDNDLQDFITHKIETAKRDRRVLYVFGERFPGGIHDIHMNQGNPADSRFAGDNGIHQDGVLIIENGLNSFTGIFLAFQTQLIPTDDRGFPLPGASRSSRETRAATQPVRPRVCRLSERV